MANKLLLKNMYSPIREPYFDTPNTIMIPLVAPKERATNDVIFMLPTVSTYLQYVLS